MAHVNRARQPEPYPDPPMGSLVEKMEIHSDGPLSARNNDTRDYVGISDVELIASYNWIDTPRPEIMIPGKPARWTPPQEQQHLEEDDPNGTYYRDSNAAAYPRHPTEPAIVSIMEMHPGRLEDLDLFACGSTLGNLLRFTEGSDRPFRLLVNVVGGVVHLIRREKSPTERILGIRGFGHTFPEANTTWDFEVRGSTTHQRILRYRLGGISILIRFEADGYIPSSYEAVSSSHISAGIEPGDVEDQLNGLRVKPQRKGSDTAKHHDLVVRYGGDLVAQDRVFDLKTRASYHKDKNIVDEELPRLWLRQMEHFVLAFHRHHLFSDVTVHDIKDRVIRWERDHQPLLSSLVKLLQDIMQKARERVDGKFEIVYSGQGPLEIREQLADVGDVLSEKALGDWELWLNRQDSCGESDEEREINARPVDEPNVVGYSSDSDSGLEDFTACGTGCSYCGRCSK